MRMPIQYVGFGPGALAAEPSAAGVGLESGVGGLPGPATSGSGPDWGCYRRCMWECRWVCPHGWCDRWCFVTCAWLCSPGPGQGELVA